MKAFVSGPDGSLGTADDRRVYIRLAHEMNGNWYPWGGTVNGNSPADFVGAWRHVRDVFTQEGATNVKFVWAPNNDSVPNTSANAIGAYWPGDAYVDYLAIDGYNFGTGSSWSTWRSFSDVFGASYATVTKLSSKPLVITEIGCSTSGGDKAAWIADMFRVLPTSFPRINGIVWFNVDKERDWRIESSAEALSAFKNGLSGL
jgi:beta-mannanase